MLDQYCERLGPGLWQEPINIISNAAFLLAAGLSLIHYRKRRLTPKHTDLAVWVLIILLGLIGVGSGLFHSFATLWAKLMDTIPILTFVTVYLGIYLWRLAKVPIYGVIAALLGFQVINTLALRALPASLVNGSLFYLPSWLCLVLITLFSTGSDLRHRLRNAVFLFSGALTLRSVDRAICPQIPLGTHFLWHLLNAWLLFNLLKIIIDYSNDAPPPSVNQTHASHHYQ